MLAAISKRSVLERLLEVQIRWPNRNKHTKREPVSRSLASHKSGATYKPSRKHILPESPFWTATSDQPIGTNGSEGYFEQIRTFMSATTGSENFSINPVKQEMLCPQKSCCDEKLRQLVGTACGTLLHAPCFFEWLE